MEVMVPTSYSAPSIEISNEEYERFRKTGYATLEQFGQQVVTVPDAVYENRAQRRTKAKTKK